MTNAQAGFIAAAIMCAPRNDKGSVKPLAKVYTALLDDIDSFDLWGE